MNVPTPDGFREPWCADCIDRDTRDGAEPWIVAVLAVVALVAVAVACWSVLA